MTSVTLRTNGQVLRLSSVTVDRVARSVYSDAALTSEVTLPAVVKADTCYYLPDVAGPASAVVEQLDGTVLRGTEWDQPIGHDAVIDPLPSPLQVAADVGKLAWQDLRVPLTRAATGPTLPTLNTFRDGLVAYQFSNTTDQNLYFDVQLPHGLIGNATNPGGVGEIRPHIHWSPGNSTDTGVVRWVLEWTAANAVVAPSNVFGASASYATLQASTGVPYSHFIAEWDPIDVTALRDSAVILCRLYRDADNVADTFAGTGGAFALSVDFHYQTASSLPGSVVEYPGAPA